MRALVLSLLFLLAVTGFLFTAVMAPFSVMAFDAPGSADQWEPWAVAIGMMAMPVLFLVLILAAAWLTFRGWTRSAVLTLASPALVGALALTFWARLAL